MPGFTIAVPQTCAGGSYIRIERAAGARKLGVRDIDGRGFIEGCMSLANLAACKERINVGALLEQVRVELHRDNIEAAGGGGGPCARDFKSDYSGWNFSIGVHDWKDADRLVGKITELMDRYDLAGYVGAALYTIPCFEAD